MKAYKIGELFGGAWENAIVNAGMFLAWGGRYSLRNWWKVETAANSIGLLFDEDGQLIENLT
jgi:hypothetical protein